MPVPEEKHIERNAVMRRHPCSCHGGTRMHIVAGSTGHKGHHIHKLTGTILQGVSRNNNAISTHPFASRRTLPVPGGQHSRRRPDQTQFGNFHADLSSAAGNCQGTWKPGPAGPCLPPTPVSPNRHKFPCQSCRRPRGRCTLGGHATGSCAVKHMR